MRAFIFGGNKMAKDDFSLIACKILAYLYSCLKRIEVFDNETFIRHVIGKGIDKDYVTDIIIMLFNAGYIEGVIVFDTWEGRKLQSDWSDMAITMEGIEYLENNTSMKKTMKWINENTTGIMQTIIAGLQLV